jgi:hypothetical protein
MENALPVRRWQARQWQTETRTGSPSTSARSWPQLHTASRVAIAHRVDVLEYDSSVNEEEIGMADGITWDDLPTELEGPGTEIRRRDFGGLAVCLIRLQAGLRTDPLFAGLPDDRCQCAHWGHIMSGTMRVHGTDGPREYAAGESYYWAPGHNLEAVTDSEYLEITRSDEYDGLMGHCRRVMGDG